MLASMSLIVIVWNMIDVLNTGTGTGAAWLQTALYTCRQLVAECGMWKYKLYNTVYTIGCMFLYVVICGTYVHTYVTCTGDLALTVHVHNK